MHEASLVQGLMRIVQDTLEQFIMNNADKTPPRVREIVCQAGLLASFEPVALQDCFEIFREGTALAGARLTVETAPLHCRCEVCGKEFSLTRRKFSCPACGSDQLQFKGGNGLTLMAIHAEDNDNG